LLAAFAPKAFAAAFRRGHVLFVDTRRGTRKLAIGKPSPEELRQLVDGARALGLDVVADVPVATLVDH
jgi:hypothetical protein